MRPMDSRIINLLLLSLTAMIASTSLNAQTAISITDSIGWNTWTTGNGTVMTDTVGDQQTGQGQDDFVGDTTYAGFQQKAGTIGGVDSIAWRVRMNKYDTKGFGGSLELGMDLDGDGAIELIMKMTDKSGQTLAFATPGTGANNSPSTTSWGTFAGSLTLAATTYNYQQAGDGSAFGGNGDAFVTFAISFANLQNAVRTYAGTEFAAYTLDYSTRISFIAFTSTQGNAINQDLFGTTGNLTSASTFTSLGAGTGPMNASGIVPEPSTYAQVGVFLLAGGWMAWRRVRRARQV